jgi:hypothetical protein
MHDEDDPKIMRVTMTGSIILSLIWTLLVSAMLFALAGCGSAGGDAPSSGLLELSATDALATRCR